MNIVLLERAAFDVGALAKELDTHPQLWNQHRARTADGRSPHREVDDIWVRFVPMDRLRAGEVPCQWYPAAEQLPRARYIAESLAQRYGLPLEGVLITRIPPGGRVHEHVDGGWHAQCTEKLAVCVRADDQQRFCFEDSELQTMDGDLFWFDNSRPHWVTNESDRERITLIVCLRGRAH